MPFAAVRDIDVYYELHGTGRPLLAISGTGNDLRWSPPEQWPLNAQFEVAHYDQRGLGQTAKPATTYSMADYADDAAGLLDHLGWDSVSVVGTSFGGMVAQHLAIRHPRRVDRLVLACTSSGGEGGSSADLLALENLPEAERAQRHLALLDTRYDPQAGELPPGLDALIDGFIARSAAPTTAADRAGARRQLEARADHDTWKDLRRISAATLVIAGRYDGLAPPANAEALATRIPDATLAWADGGHAFMMQDPTCWATIADFLGADPAA